MTISNRDYVIQDLILFFKSNCSHPDLIAGGNSNVKYLCGYQTDKAGWRALAIPISELPHIHGFGYFLIAVDMDGLKTIDDVADKLAQSSAQQHPSVALAALRTGRAKFLAPASVRR